MKLPLRIVALSLPLVLTGCFHKIAKQPLQQTAPPVVAQPTPAPATEQSSQPGPEVKPSETTTTPQENKPSEQPKETTKPPVRHPKKAPQHPQVAGNPGVSAIGQLSSGGNSWQGRETAGSIQSIEHGVNGINRRLSDQEQGTANRIHEYMKKAKVALDSGDVDGAKTLVAKARVLLGELQK